MKKQGTRVCTEERVDRSESRGKRELEEESQGRESREEGQGCFMVLNSIAIPAVNISELSDFDVCKSSVIYKYLLHGIEV